MALTKYTGNVTGVAGSLITVLDAVLVTGEGWTKEYSGANKAAYKQAAGNQMYLRVQDDAVVTAKEARMTGYEAMTDVDTGTGDFPTAGIAPEGIACVYLRKSSSADSTNRPYKIFADDRTFYLFIDTGDNAGHYYAFGFGDFYSLQSLDSYRTMIIGRANENTGLTTNERLDNVVTSNLSAGLYGHYAARSYTGLGTAIGLGKFSNTVMSNGNSYLLGGLGYPNSPDGGAYFSQLWINENAVSKIRGRLRGFWHFMHPIAAVNDGDTITGTGTLTGKTIEFVKESGNSGVYAIETSDTLETN